MNIEELHLRPIEYNMCRILSALAEIVKNHDGKVKPGRRVLVKDRTVENSDFMEAEHVLHITFILDEMVYSYSLNDNPFFPFYLGKTPVIDGRYSLDAVHEEAQKDWLWDCFWMSDCSKDDIVEAANLIFNELRKAPVSAIRRGTKRREVPNMYDDGFHYENVPDPERFAAINW